MEQKRKTNKTSKTSKISKISKTSKTKTRPSPSESATEYPIGTIKQGNDKNNYVVVSTSTGVSRWMPIETVKLNGYKLLTTDFICKWYKVNYKKNNSDIKPLIIYEREYTSTYPDKNSHFNKIEWIPTGELSFNKKIHSNWLLTHSPDIKAKPSQSLFLLGKAKLDFTEGKYIDFALQIDSKHPNIVSSNVMNTEAFVKISSRV